MKNYHFVASSALVLSASAFAQIAIDDNFLGSRHDSNFQIVGFVLDCRVGQNILQASKSKQTDGDNQVCF